MPTLDDFLAARRAADLGLPLPDQLTRCFAAVGLDAERARAASVAPAYAAVADEAIAAVMVRKTMRASPTESHRSRRDRQLREHAERYGQDTIPLTDPETWTRQAETEDLLSRLSFREWEVGGRLVSVQDILTDALDRAAVLAELARESQDADRVALAVKFDFKIWAELIARHPDRRSALAAE